MNKIQFSELEISEEIIRAVTEMGFEETTPIQTMAIPRALKGKDIVGQAQTGTGKTAAFAIPMLERVDPKDKNVQALVLCPTRELAVQISEEVNNIAKFKDKISIVPVYGGQDIERQIRAIRKGAQIIIGTPGRVLDHLRRKTLKLHGLKMLTLDEADEMLNMGFREDIETVMKSVDHDIQTMLFSATMPPAIMSIINEYQHDPEILKVKHKELTTPNINQVYIEVRDRDKLETLTRLVDIYNYKLSIVFCNTKKRVDEVTDMLQARGYQCDKIHGDMKQTLRMNVIKKFKRGDIDMLVATDVAARGLDIDDVEAVFNYDMPSHEEYYVHRIGRTGRAGKEGTSFTFITYRDYNLLRNIQKYTKSEMKRHPIPKISDIEAVKRDVFMAELKDKIDAGVKSKYLQMVEEFTAEKYTTVELAATLLQMELELKETVEIDSIDNDRSWKEKRSKNKNEGRSNEGRSNGRRSSNAGMIRMHINVGTNHQVRPRDLVGAIANEAGIEGKMIGNVDIFDSFSFVEIPESQAERVIKTMSKSKIKGNKVSIEKARTRKKKTGGSKDFKKGFKPKSGSKRSGKTSK